MFNYFISELLLYVESILYFCNSTLSGKLFSFIVFWKKSASFEIIFRILQTLVLCSVVLIYLPAKKPFIFARERAVSTCAAQRFVIWFLADIFSEKPDHWSFMWVRTKYKVHHTLLSNMCGRCVDVPLKGCNTAFTTIVIGSVIP